MPLKRAEQLSATKLQHRLQDVAARLASLDPKTAAASSSISLGLHPAYQLTGPERAALQSECKRLRKAAEHNLFAAFSCEAFCGVLQEATPPATPRQQSSTAQPQAPLVSGPSPGQRRLREMAARTCVANGSGPARLGTSDRPLRQTAADGLGSEAGAAASQRERWMQDSLIPVEGSWRRVLGADAVGSRQTGHDTEAAMTQAQQEARTDPSDLQTGRPLVRGRLWQLIQRRESKSSSVRAEESSRIHAMHAVKSQAGVPTMPVCIMFMLWHRWTQQCL